MAAMYGGDVGDSDSYLVKGKHSQSSNGYAVDGERDQHVTVPSLQRLLENVNPTIDLCPLVVASNIPVELYNMMLMTDHRFPGMLDWVDGKVLVIEVPSPTHEAANRRFEKLMAYALGDHVDSHGSTTIPSSIPNRKALEGDCTFRPGTGGPPVGTPMAYWVTLVFEVGYSQPIPDLRNKATRWLTETATVNEVVIIHISRQRTVMWAEQYRRGAVNPLVHIDFGGNLCTALGQCVLHLPLASIFGGAIIPPALQGLPGLLVDIDLFTIKQAIMRAQ
jgi:hypothetical protein